MASLHPDIVGATDPFLRQEKRSLPSEPGVLICFLIGTYLYAPALGWMGYFPPHNYRQWHVIEEALTAGSECTATGQHARENSSPGNPEMPRYVVRCLALLEFRGIDRHPTI